MATRQTSTATRKTPVRKTAAKKVTPAKTSAKPSAKLAAPRQASTRAPVQKSAAKGAVQVAAKTDKQKKPKLVRDSFTIPKSEYSVIEVLKLRSQKLGRPAKKSELLRAGIKVLAAMSDIQFKAALAEVPAIKTGRPKSAK